VFEFTPKQNEAIDLFGGDAPNVMLFGGSRSGKTFIGCWIIVMRALGAKGSRHAILRFRFNHVKASVIHDTFPKMMELCFPKVKYHIDKTDWFCQFDNGSQIWFGGLDDKERTEKILGQEHATIFLNESSQIPYGSVLLAKTRLAQKVSYNAGGKTGQLRLKMIYDCNPPSQGHWTYKQFIQKRDPTNNKTLDDPDNYKSLLMNPADNAQNLPAEYLQTLEGLPTRMRDRFFLGKFADITEGALWNIELLDKWRTTQLPDMQRIVVSIDPSGSGDENNADNDAIGIIVAGLGVDGNGYVLEDLTVKAGPATWGNVAATAYDRWDADIIVGETNYGGEMVKYVMQTAHKRAPFRKVTASRGKVVRAEPISALTEQGKVRMAGNFVELEDELMSFTTTGFTGSQSPNRADAFIWAMYEIFPGMTKKMNEAPVKKSQQRQRYSYSGGGSWMG